MAMNATTLGDLMVTEMENAGVSFDDADQRAQTLVAMRAIAAAIVSHLQSSADVEAGIVVEDSSGASIGTTRTGPGKII